MPPTESLITSVRPLPARASLTRTCYGGLVLILHPQSTTSPRLDAHVREGQPAQYHNVMRILAHEVARQVTERNARLRILLRLLADLLPRPKQDVNVTPKASLLAFDVFRDIMNVIDGLQLREYPMTPGFMEFDWAHEVLGPLGECSLDIMGFLENAAPMNFTSSSCEPVPWLSCLHLIFLTYQEKGC